MTFVSSLLKPETIFCFHLKLIDSQGVIVFFIVLGELVALLPARLVVVDPLASSILE